MFSKWKNGKRLCHISKSVLPYIIIYVQSVLELFALKCSTFIYKAKIAFSVRARHDLERQTICSTMRETSLYVKGVQIWNSLCDDLKIVNIVAAFKRKCKNLLFTIYLVVDHLSTIICQDVCLCYTLYMNL